MGIDGAIKEIKSMKYSIYFDLIILSLQKIIFFYENAYLAGLFESFSFQCFPEHTI